MYRCDLKPERIFDQVNKQKRTLYYYQKRENHVLFKNSVPPKVCSISPQRTCLLLGSQMLIPKKIINNVPPHLFQTFLNTDSNSLKRRSRITHYFAGLWFSTSPITKLGTWNHSNNFPNCASPNKINVFKKLLLKVLGIFTSLNKCKQCRSGI